MSLSYSTSKRGGSHHDGRLNYATAHPGWTGKGRYCSKKDLDAMLDTFYDLRGWNRDGIPTNEKLIELGLI